VFNEETRIGGFLEAVAEQGDAVAAVAGLTLAELVIVDDGSRDGTAAAVKSDASIGDRLRVLTLPENRGKGAAVRAGMLAAGADVALVTDVDLSTPLDDLPALAAALVAGADVAIGSRALPASDVQVHQPAHRELLGKTFNVVLRALTGLPFADTQCGFKLFRLTSARALFERQRIEGFAWDAEICLLARDAGVQVVEVPVRWANDPRTHVHVVRSAPRLALDLVRLAILARRRVQRARPVPRAPAP
jgi:dolichyl-phosphate beta-glucosyltransferase